MAVAAGAVFFVRRVVYIVAGAQMLSGGRKLVAAHPGDGPSDELLRDLNAAWGPPGTGPFRHRSASAPVGTDLGARLPRGPASSGAAPPGTIQPPLPPPPVTVPTTAPPGWYQDPWDAAAQRWWDGTAWTATTR